METLLQVLQGINQAGNDASQPCDMLVGTVTAASPLEISVDTTQATLRKEVLILTEPVIEKKIVLAKHKHMTKPGVLEHSHPTVGSSLSGSYETTEEHSILTCYENGKALPTWLIQRALAVGDKVLLLSVQHGQRFIVLSRLY